MTIYNELHGNIVRNILTISTGTLPGSIIILLAIDYVPRVTWMIWTFVALAALFAVNGGTLFVAFETDSTYPWVFAFTYSARKQMCQVVAIVGDNLLTFGLSRTCVDNSPIRPGSGYIQHRAKHHDVYSPGGAFRDPI